MNTRGPLGMPRPLAKTRNGAELAVIVKVDTDQKKPPDRTDEPDRFRAEVVPLEQKGKRILGAFTGTGRPPDKAKIGIEVQSDRFVFRIGKLGTTFQTDELEGIYDKLEDAVDEQGYDTTEVRVGIL